MFLYILNQEEGKAFVELATIAYKMVSSDDVITRVSIDTYLDELHLAGYTPEGKSLSELVCILDKSTKQVRRSVIIELCGILHSDKGMNDDRLNWIYSLAEMIHIEEKESERLVRWSKDFSEFLQIGLMYINAK